MDMARGRAMVVDDDRKSRVILEKYLASSGFEVVLAFNGDEALEILSVDPYFDLIITDIMMPYVTGFDLAEKLKAYSETRDIPIIATSAFHDWRKSMDEHELTVDGFVPKPVDREILRAEIRRLTGIR